MSKRERHALATNEYEDAPELTDEQLAEADLHENGKLIRRGRRPVLFETLWVNDAELIRRIGVPEKIARAALQMLDRTRGSGFPPKHKLWGDRRYWPAVKAYFDRTGGIR